MKKNHSAKQLTLLGLMTGILLLMAYTPLGYFNIGPLAISFNMIPVAICAIAIGPAGGAIAGAVFGMTSFLQCIGVGGVSAMGAALFGINPLLAFIQRFVPRLLDGFLLGYLYRLLRRKMSIHGASAITGFFAAFLNTVFFMSALVLLFGSTEYVQNMMGGKNVLLFLCTFVGVNAVFEMIASTLITGAVAPALYKAHLISEEEL